MAFIGRLSVAKVKGGDEAVAGAEVVYQTIVPIMLAAILIVVVLCLGAATFVVFGVARPLNRMTGVVGQMAGGQLDMADSDMPGLGRGDEFGALSRALSVLRDWRASVCAWNARQPRRGLPPIFAKPIWSAIPRISVVGVWGHGNAE